VFQFSVGHLIPGLQPDGPQIWILAGQKARATTSSNPGLSGVASPTFYNKTTTTTILYDVTIFFN
jgi:hypothetical protein